MKTLNSNLLIDFPQREGIFKIWTEGGGERGGGYEHFPGDI